MNKYGTVGTFTLGSIGIARLEAGNNFILTIEGSHGRSNIGLALLSEGPIVPIDYIQMLQIDSAKIEPVVTRESLVFKQLNPPRGAVILAPGSLKMVYLDSDAELRFVDVLTGGVTEHHYIDAPYTTEWRLVRCVGDKREELMHFKVPQDRDT